MPAVRELREQYEKLIAEAKTLHAKGDALTEEDRTQFDTLLTQAGEVKAQIDGLARDDERKADLARAVDYLEKPVHTIPHGVNGDDDDRKALMGAGWEVKAGQVWVPTSLGKAVELFPEEVLFGPMPRNDEKAAEFFRTTRAAMAPLYRKAYGRYLQLCCKARSESIGYSLLSDEERKALSEGTDTAGGFLVPPDVQAEMLVRLPQFAIMRQFARVQNTSRDVLQWPMVQANATAANASIYSSGFVGSWVGETPAFSDTDPAFGLFNVPIKKVRVATKLGNDFVSDAAVNVLAWLAANGSENMALVEDQGFINGDGAALQPLGILSAQGLATGTDVEGSTANTISNTTSAAGSAPKIIDLCYALPSQYLRNARWVMRRSIEGKVRKLLDASGRFLWPAITNSGFAATPRELMGYPIENSEFMPADGTDANKVFLFGDLGAYIIGQRAQITTVVLRERFADTDQIGLIMFERVGGATWNPDSIRVGIV